MILRDIEVERVDHDQVEIRWNSEGQLGLVSIYEGSTPDEIDTDMPVAQSSGSSVVLARPSREGRRYFKVVPEGGAGKIVSERLIAFEGISNFRDLGGYETSSGRTVKWGKIYRSGDLSAATEADLANLSRLGIRVIFDLRGPEMSKENPDRLPSSDTQLVEVAMVDEEMAPLFAGLWAGDISDADVTRGMGVQIYDSFILEHTPKLAVIFQMVSDPMHLPAVFHCELGKDRTGLVAAILLTLLGVPHGTVLEDYLLTNRYTADAVEQWTTGHPYPDAVRPMLTAREEYLRASRDAVHRLFGSLEDYAANGLGMTSSMLERLRRLLLSP